VFAVIGMNRRGLKTILVPTDFLEPSDVALGVAIDLAGQQNARIYLLHVNRFLMTAGENEMMQRQMAKFSETKSIEIIPVIRKGKPYEEILKEQIEKNVDLIVIARHWERKFLPIHVRSVTEKIKRKAQCSVLVIGD